MLLLSSQYSNQHDIMTLGWHTVLQFSPSPIGCMIAGMNHSYELIRNSGRCVLNIPSASMIDEVVAIGNSHGDRPVKFEDSGLTPEPAQVADAPMIAACFANWECQLYDNSLVVNYNLFIFEIVKAHVTEQPEYSATLHYTGEGRFSVMSDKSWIRAKILNRRG